MIKYFTFVQPPNRLNLVAHDSPYPSSSFQLRFNRLAVAMLLFLNSLLLGAQPLYTVQVGTFMDVRHADFEELRPMGFVFGNPLEGNLTQVYLGNYSNASRAEATANQLKARGFKNAVVLQRPASTAAAVVIIQLSTQTYGKKTDWSQLERTGKLYVENDDQLLKIASGIYPDVATAQSLLPSIKALGYPDAFVKTIDPSRLIPVGTFETGVKKPLIPIDLSQTQPEAVPASTPAATPSPTATTVIPPATTEPTGPSTYSGTRGGDIISSPTKTPTTGSSIADLPAIRSRFKRESAESLQRLLKEKGFYTAVIDGYYGEGTSNAYHAAWDNMEELQSFHLLSTAFKASAGDPVMNWPEVKLLMTITQQLSAGLQDERVMQQSANDRAALYQQQAPPTAVVANRVKVWETTLWQNLNSWAAEDPLHARFISAFRFAYYQSAVRLEDYYMNQGLASDAAKQLATATLQNLVGGHLVRFL